MKIKCNKCDATYNIPDEKIPVKGAKTKCKKCSSQIVIPARVKNIKPEQKTDVTDAKLDENTMDKPSGSVPIKPDKLTQTTEQTKNIVADAVNTIKNKSSNVLNQISAKVDSEEMAKTKEQIKNKSAEIYNNLSEKVDSEKITQTKEQIKNTALDTANVLKNKSAEVFDNLAKEKQTSLIVTTGIVMFLVTMLMNLDIKIVQLIFKISIISFLVIMVMGCVRGAKEKLVIFYDKKDAFGSFMIVGSVIGLFITVVIIDQFLFGGSILDSDSETNSSSIGEIILGLSLICMSVYFLYRTISYSLLHNKNESNFDLALAISAKVGTGVIYPVVVMGLTAGSVNASNRVGDAKTVTDYNKAKNDSRNANIFLTIVTIAGGWLISILVNGEEVYAKRGWELYTEPKKEEVSV